MATAAPTSASAKFATFDGLRGTRNDRSTVVASAAPSAGASSSPGRVQATATVGPVQAPAAGAAKRSKVEIYKEESDYLRYPLIDDLKNDLPNVSAASEQVRLPLLRTVPGLTPVLPCFREHSRQTDLTTALPTVPMTALTAARMPDCECWLLLVFSTDGSSRTCYDRCHLIATNSCVPSCVYLRFSSDPPPRPRRCAQLIKFHGSYMQDDREARQGGGGRAYQFMMRTRQPGGKVHNRLYLAMDDLADQFGSGTLRLTTRQTFQVRPAATPRLPLLPALPKRHSSSHAASLCAPIAQQLHGVLKANLKEVFATVIKSMGSTLGACGDLNRNVLAPEVPFVDRPAYRYCQEYADKIAALLEPQSGAYYDVWLDGEKVRARVMGGGCAWGDREKKAHGGNGGNGRIVEWCKWWNGGKGRMRVGPARLHWGGDVLFPVRHPLPSAVWLASSNNLPPRHGSRPPFPRQVLTAEAPADVAEARADNRFGTNIEGSAEPIYGTQYLPRKFKIAITVPGDNSVDILTNDLGLVVLCDDATGQLQGFNIYVGGGMGRSHRNEQTEPRLAEPLGYVAAEDVLYAVKAIVATQRDYGRRDDRKQARLKYLIRDWGIDRFRTVTEQYFGKQFQPFRPLPEWQSKPYVGWGEQVSRAALGDGRLYYGLHIENGRIKGEAKKALRAVIEKYNLPVRISANQNLMLCDVRKAWRPRITQELAAVGILGKQYVDPLNLTAMACPALPLCGLAITEAERGLPAVLKRIRAMLDKVGLRQQQAHSLVVRMTGCPNGCARPYVAELGFVGDGANSYQLWLGGTPNQTVLARVFLERVKVGELEAVLEPLFAMWKALGHKGESFGDFTNRVGFEAMKEYMGTYTAPLARQRGMARRITVDDELAGRLQEVAAQRGTTVAKLTREALLQFLAECKDE
ncbi:unnamed protein product [Closterium sp. NIES-65]|nr:unnamed protein product [Closterium sp. NIES-65]